MSNLAFPEIADHDRIAVAVSGGADSMALAHMLSYYAQARHKPLHIHALTVDHALRADSADEAARVGVWLSQLPHVSHHILRWDCPKPVARIMEAARAARYRLMINDCQNRGISMLAVAHHGDDQAETFLMRLARGSGLDGLAAMRPMHAYGDKVSLWRPLLGMAHDDLVTYCRINNLPWVEDPTNRSQRHTRNRLRASRAVLEAEGLSSKRLNETARRLDRASDALRILSERLLERALLEKSDDAWTLNLGILKDEPAELTVRVLRRALEELGAKKGYGPRLEKVEEITHIFLETAASHTLTLSGCVLRADPRRQTLEISRENPANNGKSLPLSANGL